MLFYLIVALIIVFTLIFQVSFLSFLFVDRALPDILLVIVVVLGFLLNEKKGAVIGLCGGLLQDLLLGHTLGLFALSKMLVGIGAGLIGREVYRGKILVLFILAFMGTVMHEILTLMLRYLFLGEVSLELAMLGHFVEMAAYNSLLAILVFLFFHWLYQKGDSLGLQE